MKPHSLCLGFCMGSIGVTLFGDDPMNALPACAAACSVAVALTLAFMLADAIRRDIKRMNAIIAESRAITQECREMRAKVREFSRN
jgi:hypothetical protein